MIDKEKLLRVAKREYGPNGVVYKFISNFPEEPEIDFDAIWNEFNKVCTLNCSKCQFIKHNNVVVCYNEFLKSKNLTAPQIDMDQLRHEVYSEIVKSRVRQNIKFDFRCFVLGSYYMYGNTLVRFIKVTSTGYNFLCIKNNNLLFKRNLYKNGDLFKYVVINNYCIRDLNKEKKFCFVCGGDGSRINPFDQECVCRHK